MNLRMLSKIGATGLAMLPLLGSTCVEDKVVDLILTASAEAEFVAEGSVNTHHDTDTVNLKDEVDLGALLAENDIDPMDLDADAFQVSKLYYKVVVPQAGRSIANGVLKIQRGAAGAQITLATGFGASMGAMTDWIDITDLLNADGVDLLNDFLADCVAEAKGGAVVSDDQATFTYDVSGDSLPQGEESNFTWAAKLQFQGTVPTTLSLPNI